MANPKVWPGPQQYWRVRPEKLKFGKKKVIEEKEDFEEVEINGVMVKKYFMDRKKTDKIISKPMKTHIF